MSPMRWTRKRSWADCGKEQQHRYGYFGDIGLVDFGKQRLETIYDTVLWLVVACDCRVLCIERYQ